jgi:hypothetical protein
VNSSLKNRDISRPLPGTLNSIPGILLRDPGNNTPNNITDLVKGGTMNYID